MGVFRLTFLMASVVTCGLAAWTEEACGPCDGEDIQFPNEAAYLESQGYSPEEYSLLLTWSETSKRGVKETVCGYRVKPLGEGEPFDLYSDSEGHLLNAQELDALGIKSKDWNLAPEEAFPENASAPYKSNVSKPQPLMPLLSTFLKAAPLTRVDLPPVDLDKVKAEDESGASSPRKGVTRTGVFQELTEPIRVEGATLTNGAWLGVGFGSHLWAVTLHSEGAIAQRIHFRQLELPAGSRVIVYNASNPEEAYGPFTHMPPGETELWSPSCFAEDVTVECFVPAGSEVGDVRLTIDRTVHIYTGFGDVQWAKSAPGTCNLDVSCYPDWATTSHGVGGLGTIGATGTLWCTGTLVVDTDPTTQIPYFLTANHCVGTQTKASTIEVYWLYQTDACDGAAPSASSVPRTTGGADFLAGISNSEGTDFTLLRLRNAPPEGITYVGWSNSPVAVGTPVTCIHHPRGDYKRISFATTQAAESDDLKPLTHYVKALWYDGTTEPGSSGSPLMLSSQQIVGQLYGGLASCSLTNEPDFFGRFDVSYPLLREWLNPADNPADVDKSGGVDAVDIQIVIDAVLGFSVAYDADIDGSNTVDAVDVQLVILAALGYPGR